MNFKKIMAGVCAGAMVAGMSVMPVLADDALVVGGTTYTSYLPANLSANDDSTKTLQIPLYYFYKDSTSVIDTITITGTSTYDDYFAANGWAGGGGNVGLNCGADGTDWAQDNGEWAVDDSWANDATWTYTYDPEITEMTYETGILQLGWWWGVDVTVESIEVTYKEGTVTSTGNYYIAVANGDWGIQYWGDVADNIVASNTTVEESGDYSVSLFTTGDATFDTVAFIALLSDVKVADGEKDLEVTSGYDIQITSVKTYTADGTSKDVTLANDGQIRAEESVYRVNLYNSWTGDANDMIIDPAELNGAVRIDVAFTVTIPEATVETSANDTTDNNTSGSDGDVSPVAAFAVISVAALAVAVVSRKKFA